MTVTIHKIGDNYRYVESVCCAGANYVADLGDVLLLHHYTGSHEYGLGDPVWYNTLRKLEKFTGVENASTFLIPADDPRIAEFVTKCGVHTERRASTQCWLRKQDHWAYSQMLMYEANCVYRRDPNYTNDALSAGILHADEYVQTAARFLFSVYNPQTAIAGGVSCTRRNYGQPWAWNTLVQYTLCRVLGVKPILYSEHSLKTNPIWDREYVLHDFDAAYVRAVGAFFDKKFQSIEEVQAASKVLAEMLLKYKAPEQPVEQPKAEQPKPKKERKLPTRRTVVKIQTHEKNIWRKCPAVRPVPRHVRVLLNTDYDVRLAVPAEKIAWDFVNAAGKRYIVISDEYIKPTVYVRKRRQQ